MKLEELTAYAEEKYHISEEHKWMDFPGFSVLVSPVTGKWVALLMRQWDSDSGMMIERCDIKCGRECLKEEAAEYLSAPIRMAGSKWVGVKMEDRTDEEVIFRLFDRAVSMESGDFKGFTVVLEEKPARENVYKETPLPPSSGTRIPPRPKEEAVPERIREMRRLYQYGSHSFAQKCRNFYRQGKFMEDYEDDVPWRGEFKQYFTTYHDLTVRQLRGYFSWRTKIRKGEYHPITTSLAYMYLYELLNEIGTDSPEDSLRKMEDFVTGYLDSGVGDPAMKKNTARWMFEFAVLHRLPPETAAKYLEEDVLKKDQALAVLRDPADHTDEEIFDSMCMFAAAKASASPVILQEEAHGKQLFASVWKTACAQFKKEKRDLFTGCFGEQRVYPWRPLANAVYLERQRIDEADYVLNECRSYRCRNGAWREERYEKLYFDRSLFQGLFHETDLKLRRALKTGHYLKEKPEDSWADPIIDFVIEEDKRAQIEAARPKIHIDLSGLDQIRRDSLTTRDSLLSEEEIAEMRQMDNPVLPLQEMESAQEDSFLTEENAGEKELQPAGLSLGLDPLYVQILQKLLQNEPIDGILRENQIMASIAADAINEAFYDEIGDTILEWDEDRLSLIEDYTEDIEQILGGNRS